MSEFLFSASRRQVKPSRFFSGWKKITMLKTMSSTIRIRSLPEWTMRTSPISIVAAASLMCTSLVPALHGADDALVMSRGQYWLTAWAARPILSLVADVDGDGRADLVAFDPRGNASLGVHRTSILGKPTPQVAARERFGREGLAAVAGRFTRGAGEDVVAVFADGSVRIASGTRRGGASYATTTSPRRSRPA